MNEQDDEKVIFKVSRYGDESSMVEVNISGTSDITSVAIAIIQIMHKNNGVKKLVKLAEALGLEELISEGAVHIPDFNKFFDGDDADPKGE